MAKLLPFDSAHPFDNRTATERIRLLWQEGNYVLSAHAEERMEQRNFSDGDVAFLIVNYAVKSRRKQDGVWRYKISGRSVDGDLMAAVFEIDGSFITLVTVHHR
jgi:hypothetical protein